MKSHNKAEKHPDIALYDRNDYDYEKYWQTRTYEHESERIALERIFKTISGNWFVDIGGSFGRHIPLYHQKFHNCILLDYSINALKKARDYLREKGITNVHLIAANAYNLPLAGNTIQVAMMIRVLHHLETPNLFFEEIKRILNYKGSFILEYPNKQHLKNIIRKTAHFDLRSLFSVEPVEIPFKNPEGAAKTGTGIMFNYHPRYISNLLVSREIKPITTTSVSFLRIPRLKQLLNLSSLLRIEKCMQRTLSWTKLTPSVIIRSDNIDSQDLLVPVSRLEDILVCPSCKQNLTHKSGIYTCNTCSLEFSRTEGILDFRYPLLS